MNRSEKNAKEWKSAVGPDAICRFGISRTFQNIRLFLNLSVLDNVKIGAHSQMNAGLGQTLLRSPSQRVEEERVEKQAMELLRFVGLENLMLGEYQRRDKSGIAESMEREFSLFPILKERHKQMGGTLSGGEQQMLAIARALMGTPRLLLLD